MSSQQTSSEVFTISVKYGLLDSKHFLDEDTERESGWLLAE